MTIYALEGPDRCGKTTILRTLPQDLVYTRRFGPQQALKELEEWERVYDRNCTYICDRHPLVSDPVYAAYHGVSSGIRPSWLREELVVLYLDAPLHLLELRFQTVPDADACWDYMRLLMLYEWVLPRFRSIRLDARLSVEVLRERVLEIVL